MTNEQLISLTNQIQNGTGLGKLTKSNLNSNLKLRLFRLVTDIKESNAAKSLVEYQTDLQNKMQNGELTEAQANQEFFEVLKQESDLEIEKVQFPATELPDEFYVNDMELCRNVIEFVENE